MSVPKRWSKYCRESILRVKDEPGAYQIASSNKTVIYNGGSEVSIRSRLMAHFSSNRFPTARWFRCSFAGIFDSGIDMEARNAAKFARKHGRKPKHQHRAPRVERGIFNF